MLRIQSLLTALVGSEFDLARLNLLHFHPLTLDLAFCIHSHEGLTPPWRIDMTLRRGVLICCASIP